MQESEEVSALIAGIYDAALDPSLWSCALEETQRFVGGRSATLFAHDTVRPHATLFYDHGNDPHFLRLYNEKYIHLNPLMPAMAFFEAGKVFSLYDMISDGEFRATRFYKEFSVPQGIVDSLFCNLDKTGTSHSFISVPRGTRQGRVDAQARRRLSLLVPHFRRSVLISNLMECHEAEKSALVDTLGRVAGAVFLLDSKSAVCFANERAEALLSDGTILRRSQHAVTAADAGANRALQAALVDAQRGDAALGVGGVAIPLTPPEGERWLAHVLPLTSGARKHAGMTYAAVVAVFVRKVSLDIASPLETVAKIYKLTAMEVRVLQAVTEVGGSPAISDELGISATTVKTHLKGLFDKTGERRQADLVKLVAAHASPILH